MPATPFVRRFKSLIFSLRKLRIFPICLNIRMKQPLITLQAYFLRVAQTLFLILSISRAFHSDLFS